MIIYQLLCSPTYVHLCKCLLQYEIKKRLIEDWKIEPKDDFFGSFRQASESSMNFYNSKLVYKQAYPKMYYNQKTKRTKILRNSWNKTI